LRYYRLRTIILVTCVSLTISLPVAVHILVRIYNKAMVERAESAPLVLGAVGSPSDLVLNALHFKGRLPRRLSMAEVAQVKDSGLAVPVPMHVAHMAGNIPIVGTSLDYFSYRNLHISDGLPPAVLGDAVLGVAAARRLGLSVGDKLLSDYEKIYDISASYPLRMNISGILEPSNSPDDSAVFVDIKTAWIIEGIGHGHKDARSVSDPDEMLGVSGRNLIMSAGAIQFNEITDKNLASYHFHGDPAAFPVSAIMVFPHDAKSGTILKARYRDSGGVQAIVPLQVVREMMDIVFRVKRFFDLNFATVAISTTLFLVLVVLLSLRIRQREFQTLHKVGCSRSTVLALQVAEVSMILLLSAFAAAALVAGWILFVERLDALML
jgi:putative ABC transport system permease protein